MSSSDDSFCIFKPLKKWRITDESNNTSPKLRKSLKKEVQLLQCRKNNAKKDALYSPKKKNSVIRGKNFNRPILIKEESNKNLLRGDCLLSLKDSNDHLLFCRQPKQIRLSESTCSLQVSKNVPSIVQVQSQEIQSVGKDNSKKFPIVELSGHINNFQNNKFSEITRISFDNEGLTHIPRKVSSSKFDLIKQDVFSIENDCFDLVSSNVDIKDNANSFICDEIKIEKCHHGIILAERCCFCSDNDKTEKEGSLEDIFDYHKIIESDILNNVENISTTITNYESLCPTDIKNVKEQVVAYKESDILASPSKEFLLHASSHENSFFKKEDKKSVTLSKNQISITQFFQPLSKTSTKSKILEKILVNPSDYLNNSIPDLVLKKEIPINPLLYADSKSSSVKTSSTSYRNCPFYKKIPDTSFAVDAFCYGNIPSIEIYFLSHFHSDHYHGLTRSFKHLIYCSKATGNLIISNLRVPSMGVHMLPLNKPSVVRNCLVTLIEANHCPGAVMFLFQLKNGRNILHTGDFRASMDMEKNPFLVDLHIDALYLDTTYCSPQYTFPSQNEVVHFSKELVLNAIHQEPRTLVVCGSYCIGKEKIFVGVAEALQSQVFVSKVKMKNLNCLEDEQITKLLTINPHNAQVHVLPMCSLTFQNLKPYLEKFEHQYSNLLALRPTGWAFNKNFTSLYNIQPKILGSITIYGIPYSEHSSFNELKNFVQFLKPLKILPTVNNGSASSRDKMANYFKQWLHR